MSEEFDHLNDEDIEALDQIVEGSLDRQRGEHILQMWQEGHERREQEDRALLDALSRAQSGGNDAA